MKKFLLSSALLFLLISGTFGQFTKIGGGLFYDHRYYFNNEPSESHKLGNPAIFVTGIYEINLPFHIAPRISMFFPNITTTDLIDYTSKTVITGYSLDVDGHYVFNSLDRFELYGIAGLNILMTRNKTTYEFVGAPETFKTTNTDLGLNLGIGSYMKLKEQFDLYGELKCIVAGQVQFVGTVGILLNIDWLAKNEDPGY